MGKKALVRTYLFAVMWCVIAMTVLITSTYAWFTLRAIATITPMRGMVGTSDGTLLISNQPDRGFDVSCELTPDARFIAMKPVSTDDLKDFYRLDFYDGVHGNYVYTDGAERVATDVLHGYLYLKSEGGAFDIYIQSNDFKVAASDQMLAALRLGLVFTGEDGEETVIFKLDSFGTGGALQEVENAVQIGQVVGSLGSAGGANYSGDPCAEPGDYSAVFVSEESGYRPGSRKLCHIPQDTITTVEYFVYMEGCDIHCINELQEAEIEVQLGFAGVPFKRDSGSEGTDLEQSR